LHGGRPPVCAVFSQSEIVFDGTVTEVSKESAEPNENLPVVTVVFSVERIYKGAQEKIISIQAIANVCFQKYAANKRYLIYAVRTPKGQLRDIRSVTLVSQDRAKDAKDDYEYLQNLFDGKAMTSIHGFVYHQGSNNPVKGIAITVEGEGKIYRIRTEENGYFKIINASAGSYKIRCTVTDPALIVPTKKEMSLYDFQHMRIAEFNVTIAKGECSYTQFELWIPEEK
jgi:hypothetical protein